MFGLVLRCTDTANVKWRHASFTGGGGPQVPRSCIIITNIPIHFDIYGRKTKDGKERTIKGLKFLHLIPTDEVSSPTKVKVVFSHMTLLLFFFQEATAVEKPPWSLAYPI